MNSNAKLPLLLSALAAVLSIAAVAIAFFARTPDRALTARWDTATYHQFTSGSAEQAPTAGWRLTKYNKDGTVSVLTSNDAMPNQSATAQSLPKKP